VKEAISPTVKFLVLSSVASVPITLSPLDSGVVASLYVLILAILTTVRDDGVYDGIKQAEDFVVLLRGGQVHDDLNEGHSGDEELEPVLCKEFRHGQQDKGVFLIR